MSYHCHCCSTIFHPCTLSRQYEDSILLAANVLGPNKCPLTWVGNIFTQISGYDKITIGFYLILSDLIILGKKTPETSCLEQGLAKLWLLWSTFEFASLLKIQILLWICNNSICCSALNISAIQYKVVCPQSLCLFCIRGCRGVPRRVHFPDQFGFWAVLLLLRNVQLILISNLQNVSVFQLLRAHLYVPNYVGTFLPSQAFAAGRDQHCIGN